MKRAKVKMPGGEVIEMTDHGYVKPGEVVRAPSGHVYDDATIDEIVEEVNSEAARRGRPSLSQAGESPQMTIRVSRELQQAIRAAAAADRMKTSDWIRRTLGRAAKRRLSRRQRQSV